MPEPDLSTEEFSELRQRLGGHITRNPVCLQETEFGGQLRGIYRKQEPIDVEGVFVNCRILTNWIVDALRLSYALSPLAMRLDLPLP